MVRLIVWARTAAAAALAFILLEGANWAVRECSTGPDASENCLWLGVRRRFGLPAGKLARAAVLEAVGLAIFGRALPDLSLRLAAPETRAVTSRC